MKPIQFATRLGLITILSIALIFALNFLPQISEAQSLSWTTILIFIVFSILIYFMANYSANQKNKNLFSSVILMGLLFKMVLCVLVVGIYVKVYQPTSNFFLIPFFAIYVLYTIFEVYFMTRIGKNEGVK